MIRFLLNRYILHAMNKQHVLGFISSPFIFIQLDKKSNDNQKKKKIKIHQSNLKIKSLSISQLFIRHWKLINTVLYYYSAILTFVDYCKQKDIILTLKG